MPSSTVSLEPLSSPSPSPPPPETNTISSNSNHSGAGAGLDSGSELSELTEDEQDNDNGNDDDEERPRPLRRGGRKKRGGIVPAPMWDWAYKKGDSSWRTKLIEEEEEEEQAGPAEAMEEEEDEGHDDNTPPTTTSVPPADPPENGEDEPEDEEDPPEDDDDASEGAADQSTVRAADRTSNDADPASDDEEVEPLAERDVDDAPLPHPAPREASLDPSDDENAEEEERDNDAGNDEEEARDPEPPVESDDDADNAVPPIPNGTSVETSAPPVASTTLKVTTTTTVVDIIKTAELDSTSTPMDIDDSTPVSVISPVVAPVAQSSIMAGADVVVPASPSSASSSASASPRGSPSPSRSPSAEPGSDREAESKITNGRPSAKAKAAAGKTQNARLTRTRSRRKTKGNEGLDQDGGDIGRLTTEGDDRDLADAEDVDIDSPDMELETDVLPVHRAEALDVLAQIELKFALLREKVYVEKMEGFAWEEALIAEDNHPEMLHLHTELDKRRDKRLDLAERRRDFEVANVTKRRKLDEDGIWSWWKTARDDLQAEMTSEMNRRRRKLDRERRNLDRPQPVRAIPGPPLEIPMPPTVYEIVKANPFNAPSSRYFKARKQEIPPQYLVYPQLTSLSNTEIMGDLDFLYSHRRPMGFDLTRQGMMGPGPMLGHPLGAPPGFDPFNMSIGMLDGPGVLNRFGPAPPPPMQHLPQPHMQGPPGFPGPSASAGPRIQNHVAPQPLPHPMMMDIDSVGIRRPSSVPGHPNHHQFPLSGPSGPINLMRRSISPVPLFTNGHSSTIHGGTSSMGSRPQGWMGDGGPGPSSHANSVKEARRPNGNDHGGLEREKDRDRLPDTLKQKERNEREREERESYLMQHAPPRHITHTHSHPHVHGSGPNPHHHTPPYHHHHHHHIVHHHHPPNGTGGGVHLPNGPVVNGAGPGSSNMGSPRIRELELHRPRSGAPTEVIDLSSSGNPKQGQSSTMSAFWKGNEDQPLSTSDRDRGRVPLGPPPVGPHDRMVPPPFGMITGYPPSPRHGPSTAPESKAPSRRGSFSAMDDNGPRPSSSHSLGPLASNHQSVSASGTSSHRLTPSGSHGGRLQASPLLQPQHSSTMHSPRGNGIRLPPLSPSNASPMVGNMRSPIRMNQTLPPPPLPTSHSQSNNTSKPTSPVDVRRRTPPPPLQTRSPLNREQPTHSGHLRTSSPMIMLPPSSSLPLPSLPPPRLPPVNLSEKHSPNLPKMKTQAVPIDGS